VFVSESPNLVFIAVGTITLIKWYSCNCCGPASVFISRLWKGASDIDVNTRIPGKRFLPCRQDYAFHSMNQRMAYLNCSFPHFVNLDALASDRCLTSSYFFLLTISSLHPYSLQLPLFFAWTMVPAFEGFDELSTLSPFLTKGMSGGKELCSFG